jgi:hypothetical protein
MELYYGEDGIVNPRGFSRFIFDIDLSLLTQKINDGTISTGCTSAMTHTLNMTNTSYFDKDFLNSQHLKVDIEQHHLIFSYLEFHLIIVQYPEHLKIGMRELDMIIYQQVRWYLKIRIILTDHQIGQQPQQ